MYYIFFSDMLMHNDSLSTGTLSYVQRLDSKIFSDDKIDYCNSCFRKEIWIFGYLDIWKT